MPIGQSVFDPLTQRTRSLRLLGDGVACLLFRRKLLKKSPSDLKFSNIKPHALETMRLIPVT